MDKDIISIGKTVVFIGAIIMIAIALLVAASLGSNLPEDISQRAATSIGPAAIIWLILSPAGLGIRSPYGESVSKDIIKALIIILAGVGGILLVPFLGIYSEWSILANQIGSGISIIGGTLIIIGALKKS